MTRLLRGFGIGWSLTRGATWADAAVMLGLVGIIALGLELARAAPELVRGPRISLDAHALPMYASMSVLRMGAAYALSVAFTLIYGYVAARNGRAEKVLIPLLDVLQSVPILSFLPVVLLGLAAIIPQEAAAEIASVVLIFTSQVWNMTFAWYQSLKTIPEELTEAARIFRLNSWLRLKTLELPFAAISLIWNSMMSWSGGWFFLMAAEMFTVGDRDFRLPGLGSYLQTAANAGDTAAILRGIFALVVVIVALDQLVWRPLIVWAERFKVEMMSGETEARSWLYAVLRASRLAAWLGRRVLNPIGEAFDRFWLRTHSKTDRPTEELGASLAATLGSAAVVALLAYGGFRAAGMLGHVSADQWFAIALGVGATLTRVTAAMLIALAWTVPLGSALSANRKLAGWLQPVVQIVASVPATALFPVLLLVLLRLPAGLNLAAVLLMLMGTQWYLLFNVIAGSSAVPQDLKYTASLLGLSRWERWRTLTLPALFPYIVTGAITAGGGAWNASIVAEYVEFGGRTVFTTGIGSLVARSTAAGDFPLLLASTLAMVLTVVVINRVFWRRLYRLASDRYRME